MNRMAVVGVLLLLIGIPAAIFIAIGYFVSPVAALGTAFIVVSLLMMLVILVQKPKGGGLSGAFGGAGGGSDLLGGKTGDVLTWVTVIFFVAFLGLAMGMTWAIGRSYEAQQEPPPVVNPNVPLPGGDDFDLDNPLAPGIPDVDNNVNPGADPADILGDDNTIPSSDTPAPSDSGEGTPAPPDTGTDAPAPSDDSEN